MADILNAGAGLSSPRAARLLAEEGPALVRSILMERAGVQFDRTGQGEMVYALEGAHSTRRVVHVGDRTARPSRMRLLRALAAQPNIRLLDGHTAVDLITFPHHALDPLAMYDAPTCHGAYVMQRKAGKSCACWQARPSSRRGGLGQLYRNTSNPRGARGDGLAMAGRAGARIINMEYIQFHPTTLSVRGAPNLLISEALRGEGGVLLTADGEPFMQRHDPQWGTSRRAMWSLEPYTGRCWSAASSMYGWTFLSGVPRRISGSASPRLSRIVRTSVSM